MIVALPGLFSYLVFEKAFDTPPHELLKCKLHGYSISRKNKTLVWTESFLHKRQQRVVVNGAKSQYKGKRKVQGVPQSQTAALPRHQEEEETDKTNQAQIEQTYEKH